MTKRATVTVLVCLAGALAFPGGVAANHRHSLMAGAGVGNYLNDPPPP